MSLEEKRTQLALMRTRLSVLRTILAFIILALWLIKK